jgi:hypothetical protein
VRERFAMAGVFDWVRDQRLRPVVTNLRRLPRDTQLMHARDECCPRHPELRGGAAAAAHHPVDLLQRFRNVNAFQFLQSSFGCSGRHRREVREFLRLRAQHRTVRHQHGAFDEVLQFANIARPVVTLRPRNDRRTVHSRRDCRRTWSALLWRASETREKLAARTCVAAGDRFLSAGFALRDGVGPALKKVI